ncbi:hypothetical protein RHMOL_Rhmol13G0129500 [Rhododendron molle]|uniref:Uncharacterized protein n=1 Tax=Rhododendron molle TaxID=49168 RepID=A0ACC0L736_RHOML|nr:hypothetical protein RHMOL_Rhmol13G0129500 [Rhododendron molle]
MLCFCRFLPSTYLVLGSPPLPPLTTANNHQLPPLLAPTASVATTNHEAFFENLTGLELEDWGGRGTSTTERFEAVYPTLKEIALTGSPGSKGMKQTTQQILQFAVKAVGEGKTNLISYLMVPVLIIQFRCMWG